MEKVKKGNHGPSVKELTELGRHALDSAHSMINLTTVGAPAVEEMQIIMRGVQGEKRLPTELEFETIFGLLNAISDSTTRIEKTMKGMLAFGKGVIFDFKKLPVNVFMFNLMEGAKALSGDLVSLQYEFCPKLSEKWCSIDKEQLADCMFHLIKNAVESKAKTIIIATSVETTPKGQFIEISVANDGIPIPEEFLAKIFDLSFTTKKKGNGIGLAQVHRIIEAHGGHIDVSSKCESTAFRLYLPL